MITGVWKYRGKSSQEQSPYLRAADILQARQAIGSPRKKSD
ncbi:TA system toxin CbtA family protein [Escherichia coli]